MAGTNLDFNASEFRAAIKGTMQMGMPTDDAEKLTWYFKRVKAWSPQDPAIRPYDWTATPTVDAPADPDNSDGQTIVDYALEFSASSSTETDVGRMDTSKAVVTLLDVDYNEVSEADYAMVGSTTYEIEYVGPPIGMFDCTIYQVYLRARDEA